MHFLMVGMLSFLVNLSLQNARVSRIQLGTAVLSLGFILEEFSQRAFDNRTFDWSDMACNFAGIIVFGLLAWLLGGVLGIREA